MKKTKVITILKLNKKTILFKGDNMKHLILFASLLSLNLHAQDSECIKAAPSILVHETQFSGEPGASFETAIEVKSNNINCGIMEHKVWATNVPYDYLWEYDKEQLVDLADGETKILPFKFTSNYNALPGTYVINVSARIADGLKYLKNEQYIYTEVTEVSRCLLQSIDMSVTPSHQSSDSKEELKYDITFTNKNVRCGLVKYDMRSYSQQNMMQARFSDNGFTLSDGETKSLSVYISPSKKTKAAGIYKVGISVFGDDKERGEGRIIEYEILAPEASEGPVPEEEAPSKCRGKNCK